MKDQNTKYDLSFGELEYTMSLLNKEQDFTISKNVIKVFKWLRISIYFIFITTLWYVITYTFIPESIAFIIATFCWLFNIFTIIILVFLCIPHILKIYKVNKQIKKIGLDTLMAAPWHKERKKTKMLNKIDNTFRIFGVLLIVFMGFSIIGQLMLYYDETEDFTADDLLYGGIGVIIFFIFGLTLLLLAYFRKTNIRLKVLRNMQNSLGDYLTKGKNASPRLDYHMTVEGKKEEIKSPEEVTISEKDYNFLAKLERAQITREQAMLISKYQTQNFGSIFSIQKSGLFHKAINNLELKLRYTVEQQIDVLLNQINDAPNFKDLDDSLQKLTIPVQPVIVVEYQIDSIGKRIKLISLIEYNKQV